MKREDEGWKGECTLSNQSCRQQINLMSDTRHKTCRLAVERGIVDEGADGGNCLCRAGKGIPRPGLLAVAIPIAGLK